MANFTERAIKETFIKLLSERPLSQITVKDIVQACGINRNSFYYHFQDIPSLIEKIIIEEADRIIAEYPSLDSLEMGFNAAIDFAEKHRHAILNIFRSVNREIFEQYLWKVCDYVVVSYGKTVFADKPITDEDRDLIIQFYKAQCFGMVIDWLRSGMREDVHNKIHRICELQKGMFEEMIRRSIESKDKGK